MEFYSITGGSIVTMVYKLTNVYKHDYRSWTAPGANWQPWSGGEHELRGHGGHLGVRCAGDQRRGEVDPALGRQLVAWLDMFFCFCLIGKARDGHSRLYIYIYIRIYIYILYHSIVYLYIRYKYIIRIYYSYIYIYIYYCIVLYCIILYYIILYINILIYYIYIYMGI